MNNDAKKVIINGHGYPFEAKENQFSSSSDIFFIWKNNIHYVNKQFLKFDYKNRKLDANKSKQSRLAFKIFLKTIYKFNRYKNNYNYLIKKKLIYKNYLTIKILDNKITEALVFNDQFNYDYVQYTNETENVIKNIYSKLLKLKLNQEYKKFAILLQDVGIILKEFTNKSQKIVKQIKTINNINDQCNKRKKSLKTNNRKIFLIFKETYQNLKKNKNLNLDNFIYEFYKAKVNYLQPNYDQSYDLEYQYQLSKNIYQYREKLIKLTTNFRKQKEQLTKKIKIAKKQMNQQEVINANAKLKIVRKNYINLKRDQKMILKASSASKRSQQVVLKKINNDYKFEKMTIKKQEFVEKVLKNNLYNLKVTFFRTKKILKKNLAAKKSELLKSIPEEITKLKYIVSITIGSLIPGFSSLINKRYFKAILLLLGTVLFSIILAWIFGAFPSKNGNGIMGLINLGHNPKTQTPISIGMTNGQPNDGRFYLVSGALAIIFLVISIGFFLISALNNINVTNLRRLGIRSTKFKQQKELLKGAGIPYLLSTPAFIFIIFIVIMPVLATILISFTNIGQKDIWDVDNQRWLNADGVAWPISWKGLDQFKYITKIAKDEFGSVFLWTIIWTFSSASIVIVIGTLLAMLVNNPRIKGKTIIRIIYILPWAIPAFITIMYFSIFFQVNGVFNEVIGNEIFTPKTEWLNNGSETKVLMIFLQGWLGNAYIFLLITGMLQSIPKNLYEAARVDGASSLKQFRDITMPIILSQISPLLIGQFTFAFNNFGLIYLLNDGGFVKSGRSSGEFDIFISWIYKLVSSGSNSKPGVAAALSLIISVFTITPSAILFLRSKSFKRRNF